MKEKKESKKVILISKTFILVDFSDSFWLHERDCTLSMFLHVKFGKKC